MKIILQKYIAESGYCSRRKAEDLIRQSVGTQYNSSSKKVHQNAPVLVNGKLPELGMKVDENDVIKVFGKIISLPKRKVYLKLNKPVGYVCTNKSFKEEKSVFALIPNPSPAGEKGVASNRLIIAGRLDKDSRGLLLLTNDGDLVARLTHPRYEHEKEYLVTIMNYELRIKNNVDDLLLKFKKGINIGDDGIVRVKRIENLGSGRFKLVLTEGKKRQIRRMFRALGLEVKDLVRVRIGSLELGNLKEGKWQELTDNEVRSLK